MKKPSFSELLKTFEPDLQKVKAAMRDHLTTEALLIADMENRDYLIGGKQFRAIVALLSCRHCRIDDAIAHRIATAIEFIHTATLMHDDVVDEAPVRRHLPSAAVAYGNAAAVLAGDFLYSRASQIFADIGNLALLRRVADATNHLSEGEILQLLQRDRPGTDEATYFTIIDHKTANLFQIAATAAPLLNGEADADFSEYGRHLGIAFQLTDDCLDFQGSATETGKKLGADFREGKMTLPMILMLSRIDEARREAFLGDWRQGREAAFTEAIELAVSTGAIDDTRRRAGEHIGCAIAAAERLPATAARESLIAIAVASGDRQA